MLPQPYVTLTSSIHIDALYERIQQLCDALSLEWSPTHTPAATIHREEGPFKLAVTTSSWSDGTITLTLCQEIGDNGPTHHMAWIPWFVVHATLDGLPDDVRVELDGDNQGATELRRARVEGASEAMTETIMASLGAQRPATS